MIYFHEVQKSVDGQLVLDSLTLHLPKTSYTLVCGEPSSGKTTLLRLIMAYERPDEGTLKVDDLDIGELPDARVPFLRRQIGYIADTPNLLDDRTVAENMAIPLQLAGIDNEVSQQRVADMLARIGLQDATTVKVKNLDADSRQLVSAARAIVHKPAIVLADDPFKDRSAATNGLIVSLLNQAHSGGATVVLTAQALYQELVINGVQLYTLNEGKITQNDLKRDSIT